MAPILTVAETKPVFSLLDIYWETSTMGLISTLNKDIQVANAPYQPTNLDFIALGPKGGIFKYEESDVVNTTICQFKINRQDGTQLVSAVASLTRVLDGNGTNVTSNTNFNFRASTAQTNQTYGGAFDFSANQYAILSAEL